MTEFLFPAALALLAMNALTYAAFGFDKHQAQVGGWRVREQTLLTLALFGGTPGAYAARSAFRHKTRKQPFSGTLHLIAVLQVLGLGTAVGWFLPELI